MKNRPYLKALYWSIVVGFASVPATIANVQAADIGMPVLMNSQAQSPAKSPTLILRNATPAKGAQGPIRTETFSDEKPKVDSEMVRRDLELQRYPMANNAGIP
ncbi:MAG TPA: hypothetical protein VN639_21325 [Azonexus sp.]|nr:hypothetical protein [Azonexus sp.]